MLLLQMIHWQFTNPNKHEVEAEHLQYADILKDIFNMIQIKFPDMRTRNLYLIGGGCRIHSKTIAIFIQGKQI